MTASEAWFHGAPCGLVGMSLDGMLTVRPILIATLAADHRVSDGHRGGLLLDTIDRFLQEPESLRGGMP